jgi:hypothetical protein
MHYLNFMKTMKIFYALVLTGFCSVAVTEHAAAQAAEVNKSENDRIDSLKMSYDANERRSQQAKDEDNLSDLKSEKSDAKEKARKAKQIERDASAAARESKNAYRAEKKAQKSRDQADRQAKKALKARNKSDLN